MKNFLFTLLTAWLCLCMNSYAQMVPGTMANLKLGNQNYVKNNMMPSQIVGSDESGIYMTKVKLKHEIRAANSFPILEHYNDQMVLTKFRELKVDNTETAPYFEGIIELDNQLFCFYSITDRSSKSKTLMAQKINKNSLSLENEIIHLQSVSFKGMPVYQSPEFHFKLSPNRRNLLISSPKPVDKKPVQEFLISVFDKDLSEIWTKEISSPFEKGRFSIENYHISNEANAYILAKTVKNANDLDSFWASDYAYQILQINKNEKDHQLIQPAIKGKFLSKMQIASRPNGDLLCAGFYVDQINTDQTGSYFLTLSAENGKISHSDFQAFTPEQNEMDDRRQNDPQRIFTYTLKDLVIRNDGSSVLMGEQATYTSGNNPRNNIPGSRMSFNNIAVISIAPEGKILWTQEIQKNQVSSGGFSFFSSFAQAIMHDKIYLVFNDHPENLCEGTCKPVRFNPKSIKKEVLITLVELDWHGSITKRALPFSKNINILTKPDACQQVSKNEMVILGQDNNSYQMAKLEFEKTFAYQ
ncbi:hypothetical protein KZP23_07610 [Echinicola marina]|uniref:hypothetical protein n=1 Tax=Echinicola marina TaxID=2859768 RepID=UPI001CF64199|nr:hypothetical protein [Echinicola marina]UCS94867.1 hypothetical protein KZP23_07610 [Echinicola marina]